MTTLPTGDAAQYVAVDLGGTTVRAALVDRNGALTARLKEPVRHGAAHEQVADLMTRTAAGTDAVSAVVGLPGRVDHVRGRLHVARNLPATDLDRLSAAHLAAVTGLAVELAGDAELAAIGETYFGAGSTTTTTAYLTLSTGIGAAVVSEGRVLSGRLSGFQIGFLHLLGADRPMIEDLGSGQRVRQAARELGRDVDHRTLRELAAATGTAPETRHARDLAAGALADIADAATAAAVLLCHVASPDVLVVGGGLARAAGAHLLDELDRRIRSTGTSHVSWDVEVRAARCGDDAGLVGAAAWHRARPVVVAAADPSNTKGDGR
ncbi:ROK family protein [Streptomyces sp. NBC_01498]|uniref:ROK family protein n=1 Tax=Streptomyces sp. NBC_01498 TaxID=2975870 RepID=UPI002E7BAEB8|nr:ROK family protein [Streptomyces sp. NBC_01498]WTL28003.1 ROK family protein [Streptomyces sp. NBC_01498]